MAPVPGMQPGKFKQQQDKRRKLVEDTKPMIEKLPKGGAVPKKASPGPGATGTGGGRDTPAAGKERGIFEKDRQGRMQGSGGDRPPIYKPPPHVPGNYQSNKIPVPPKKKLPATGTSAVRGLVL